MSVKLASSFVSELSKVMKEHFDFDLNLGQIAGVDSSEVKLSLKDKCITYHMVNGGAVSENYFMYIGIGETKVNAAYLRNDGWYYPITDFRNKGNRLSELFRRFKIGFNGKS